MIVAFDGPQGAGKTKLAKAVAEHYGWPYIHDGEGVNRLGGDNFDIARRFHNHRESLEIGKHAVLDRWYWSTFVHQGILVFPRIRPDLHVFVWPLDAAKSAELRGVSWPKYLRELHGYELAERMERGESIRVDERMLDGIIFEIDNLKGKWVCEYCF